MTYFILSLLLQISFLSVVSKSLETTKKIQTSQNKIICFCLRLNKMAHISQKRFKTDLKKI